MRKRKRISEQREDELNEYTHKKDHTHREKKNERKKKKNWTENAFWAEQSFFSKCLIAVQFTITKEIVYFQEQNAHWIMMANYRNWNKNQNKNITSHTDIESLSKKNEKKSELELDTSS